MMGAISALFAGSTTTATYPSVAPPGEARGVQHEPAAAAIAQAHAGLALGVAGGHRSRPVQHGDDGDANAHVDVGDLVQEVGPRLQRVVGRPVDGGQPPG